jgi:hypothetical protein
VTDEFEVTPGTIVLVKHASEAITDALGGAQSVVPSEADARE